ncbi:MAG: hypothetical protein NT087_11590 [Deltaproteobacteria bacterium]|nr:hypothetical protein [Deltaproteobacteria bacterium]
MQRIRYGFIVLTMLLCLATSAAAEVSIGIGFPHVSIGINLPMYPELVPVPGYPVYYAPRLHANYFFYDGMYWVYEDDNWYASSWYNGPWGYVEPYYVPLFILRIPVGYYRQPPMYFRGWRSNTPPRWANHWGPEWEQQRRGWDRWQRSSAPARAPLPVYQRKYSGERYPQVEQQPALHSQKYRYQPRETVIREHFQQQLEHRAPAPDQRERQDEPRRTNPRQQETQQGSPEGTRSQPQHRGDENSQRSAPSQNPPQQREPTSYDQRQQPDAAQREQTAPRSHDQEQKAQDREDEQEPNRGHGQRQNRDEERGRGRNN